VHGIVISSLVAYITYIIQLTQRGISVTDYIKYYAYLYYLYLHCKKRLACNNVVENRPEQYVAAHIVPGC
jgi:hypothetical protein